MRIGIEAVNIRTGGGLTHLVEMLRAADLSSHDIERVTVWSNKYTLSLLPDRPWLEHSYDPLFDGSFLQRLYWLRSRLVPLAAESCDVLFIPSGSYVGTFRPYVTFSQNMLPFEKPERSRFSPLSGIRLRLEALRYTQGHAFSGADGMIFLTEYAKAQILKQIKLRGLSTVIPYGINDRFRLLPKPQKSLDAYSSDRPFRLLYVSIINLYKHQWCVAEAVSLLRQQGLPVQLDLFGPAYPPALARLEAVIERCDPKREFLFYHGPVSPEQVHQQYHETDAFIFASSCENLPNILLEAMASGLPIACSNRGPMPEVLGDSGIYFDPESAPDIAQQLQNFIQSPEKRAAYAEKAFDRAKLFSWEQCANDTFAFLANIAKASSNNTSPKLKE